MTRRLRALPWLEALVYVAVAVAFLRRGLAGGGLVGAGVDHIGTLWMVNWTCDALAAGKNPLHATNVFYPDGIDLFVRTGGNLLDAVLQCPLAWTFGFPWSTNLFLLVVLVGNALAMHHLVRGLGAGRLPGLACGLGFMLHGYFLREIAEGRPTQVLTWFLPLALLHLVRAQDEPGWRHPALAGLLLGLQAWTYWFDGHWFLFMGGAFLLVAAVEGRSRAYLGRLAAAAGVALLVVGPAVGWMALKATRGDVPGLEVAGSPALFPAGGDAVDPREAFAWWVLAPTYAQYLRSWPQLAVFGAALLLVPRPGRWLAAVGLGLLMLAGPTLHFRVGELANPVWSAATASLPFFRRLLFPYRGWGVLLVFLVPPVGLALQRLAEQTGRLAGAGAALGVAAVLAWPTAPGSYPLPATVYAEPAYAAAVRARPGVVLDAPVLCCGERVQFQIFHDQPLVGGMAEHLAAIRPPDVLARIEADPLLSAIRVAAAGGEPDPVPAEARGEPVAWVVFHNGVHGESDRRDLDCWRGPSLAPERMDAAARAALVRLLGEPVAEDRMAAAWDLRRR